MDLGFKGKVALVTGAGSQVGFGKAIALLLAKEGCQSIVVSDLFMEDVQKTADDVKKLGSSVLALTADITNRQQVTAMVKQTIDKFGQIDILCNVAGAILHKDNQPLETQNEEVWAKQMNLNLFGTMLVSQAVLPFMKAKKYGVIVNVGSGSTHQYSMGVGMYAISKVAIDLFTKQEAYVDGKNGIRINCVAPGPAPTNFGKILKEGAPVLPPEVAKANREAFIKSFPLQRLGTAADIANAVVIMASDVTSYITGQVIHVSGGAVL